MTRPLVVLGMHRSGTSAITRALALLGVRAPATATLGRGGPPNPMGFWEISSLTWCNEQLLRARGGEWSAPPVLTPARSGPEERLLSMWGARRLARTGVVAGAVWKDPRLSLLLDWWRPALAAVPAVILVVREPGEVAQSLARRNGFAADLSHALWEWYNVSALRQARHCPLAIVRFEQALADERTFLAELDEWLADAGAVPAGGPRRSRDGAMLEPRLRRNRGPAEGPRLTPEQAALAAALLPASGFYEDVPAALRDLRVSAATAGLIAARRRQRSALRRPLRRRTKRWAMGVRIRVSESPALARAARVLKADR